MLPAFHEEEKEDEEEEEEEVEQQAGGRLGFPKFRPTWRWALVTRD